MAQKKAVAKEAEGGLGDEFLVLEASQDGVKYEPDGCPVTDLTMAKVMAGMAKMAMGKKFPNMKFRIATYKRAGSEPLEV